MAADDLLLNLQLFCSNLKIKMSTGTPVQGGTQYELLQGYDKVYLTIYNTGTAYARGANSQLLDLLKVWCDQSYFNGMLIPDFASSWREWNTNAQLIKDYQAVNGTPNEADAPEDYRINREILFHDYMFNRNRGERISLKAIDFVVKNWMKRFCFMNIPGDKVIEVAYKHLQDNTPIGFDGNNVPFSFAAEMISVAFSGFCWNKQLSCIGDCPFKPGKTYDCLCELVDLLYMYSESPKVISYNKTNLNKLMKGNFNEVSWTHINPSTPIEEIMKNALYDAGLLSYPQYQALAPTRKFRVDYMIPTPNGGLLAVECDGLQYHAKPSCYIGDRQRDNLLLQQGITQVRFSSVDIQQDIEGCIKTIENLFGMYQTGKMAYYRNCSPSYFNSNE